MFPSINTRWAFFNSSRFLIVQALPAYVGSFAFQLSGLVMWLRRISMSDGTRFGIDANAPPNMMFSPAPAR